jgi:hypothetical protein
LSDTDADVDAFFDHVDYAIRQSQIHCEIGMCVHHPIHDAYDMLAEIERCGYAKQTARIPRELADGGIGVLERVKRFEATFEVYTPRFRQRYATRRAVEQPRADLPLERADVLARSGVGYSEVASRSGKAGTLGHAHEYLHALQAIHAVMVAPFPYTKQSIS